jgi:hypothetical protein
MFHAFIGKSEDGKPVFLGMAQEKPRRIPVTSVDEHKGVKGNVIETLQALVEQSNDHDEQLNDLEQDAYEAIDKLDLLIDHLGLEYVKENVDGRIRTFLRKKKKTS